MPDYLGAGRISPPADEATPEVGMLPCLAGTGNIAALSHKYLEGGYKVALLSDDRGEEQGEQFVVASATGSIRSAQ